MSVGILGIGTYLPPHVRTNDFFPEHDVRAWREKVPRRAAHLREVLLARGTEGARLSLAAIESLANDPFQGARERRVLADDRTGADMETIAAEEAIARAGIDRSEIDLVVSHQILVDWVNVPSAAIVHHRLGLSERCTTLAVDAACNAWMNQLTLAKGMIASGQARYALVLNGAVMSRLGTTGDLIDAWNGDGAAATILGPVAEGRGILAYSHHTEGKNWGALTYGQPGKRWQEGPCVTYPVDKEANLSMVTGMADRAQSILGETLVKAGVSRAEIAFYAAHCGFKWLLPVTQEVSGLAHARSIDHFHYTGTMSSVNLPFQLAVAERENLLRAGDLVACFSGGTGMTHSGMVLRWGVT